MPMFRWYVLGAIAGLLVGCSSLPLTTLPTGSPAPHSSGTGDRSALEAQAMAAAPASEPGVAASPLDLLTPGMRYQVLPMDIFPIISWTITRIGVQPEYTITRVRAERREALLLEQVLQRDNQQTIYELQDILPLPPRHPNDRLLAEHWCSQRGNVSSELVVVVEDEPQATLTHIRHAWRANTTRGKFEAIAVAGIECQNSGWEY